MPTIDIAKRGATSLSILNEHDFREVYRVALPPGLLAGERREAEKRLTQAGFRCEYEFNKVVVDRRSQTLAKAQAASISSRIRTKAGLEMQISHVLFFSG